MLSYRSIKSYTGTYYRIQHYERSKKLICRVVIKESPIIVLMKIRGPKLENARAHFEAYWYGNVKMCGRYFVACHRCYCDGMRYYGHEMVT